MWCELDKGMERWGKVLPCGWGEFGAAMVEEECDEMVLSESLRVASSEDGLLLELHAKGGEQEEEGREAWRRGRKREFEGLSKSNYLI